MKSRFILICLMVILSVCNLYGQGPRHKIDITSAFKMHLFLDAMILSEEEVTKDDSLYFKYSSNIKLNLKKLDSEFFHKSYLFYSLNAETGIKYGDMNVFPFGGHMPFTTAESIS